MSNKQAYLTIDIEEWYHLDYLKKYELDKNSVETVRHMTDFLNLLNKIDVKATFFVLAEVAHKYEDIIKDIYSRGHEIGCHGLDHDLLYNKTNNQFREEILKARNILNELVGEDVVKGYRASCFSMTREKLDILKEVGFEYDSSYIKFLEHPLYGDLKMDGFTEVDDLIYELDNFYEFEIPTYKVAKYDVPISGGGYMRLIPSPILNKMIKSHFTKYNNYLIYLHPFELTNVKLPFPNNITYKDKFRASVGRKNNLRKLEKILLNLKQKNCEFITISDKITLLKERNV